MKKWFVCVLVLAALAIPATALASPGLKLDKQGISPKQCQPDGSTATQLVNVHYTLVNDYDSGFGGNAWANDTIHRQMQIWQLADGTFCVRVADHGEFVTFAGTSPGGSSTVGAGVEGEVQGGYVSDFFSGTFAPTRATRGDLGTFDLMCDAHFNCAGAHPSYVDYFSPTPAVHLAQWGWIYHAGKHGTWLNQQGVAAADSGDITGAVAAAPPADEHGHGHGHGEGAAKGHKD